MINGFRSGQSATVVVYTLLNNDEGQGFYSPKCYAEAMITDSCCDNPLYNRFLSIIFGNTRVL